MHDKFIQASATTEANMNARRSVLLACVSGVAALGCGVWSVSAAPEQPYPNRLIKLIVPFEAGGPLDIIARALADKLSVSLKQPFVIENRPGAGGNIGANAIARAAPDGYTLGLVLGTTLTVNPSLFKKLPFDPDADFRPISIVTTSGSMLVVHPSVPVNSVAEFVAYAKAAAARKEPIAYASGGNGNPGHLVMENFRLHAGFEAIHVPYRGNGPMVVDLVAGQVKTAFVTSSGMMDHVLAGRLRGLGVSHAGRSPIAPGVPTIAESGYPGFKVENINVMLAPAGIPEPIAARLEREVQAALKLPDIIERLRVMDVAPAGIIGSDIIRARIKADRAEWAKVVAAANMRLE
jgi:tripartite-type tricarboxylate transporter receptor subunit TctC